jgi:hypothetical protein
MKTLAPEGEVRVLVTDSRQASLVSRYGRTVKQWRLGERPSFEEFKGRVVATVEGKRVPLVTDEATLRRLSDAGELADIDDLYA